MTVFSNSINFLNSFPNFPLPENDCQKVREPKNLPFHTQA